jgi:hypothetical protein
MDWRAAQMVEHLLYQYEALNSNPSPLKKKKKVNLSLWSILDMYVLKHLCLKNIYLQIQQLGNC